MDVILAPIRIATSKPAQKSYINTILFLSASSILAFFAATAYILFYVNFIPVKGITRPIHLQFGETANPYGIATLSNTLTSQQPYDITLTLHLPRSPTNIEAGNFMLDLTLLPTSPPQPLTHLPLTISTNEILYHAKRHAILTYEPRIVSLARRLVSLPAFILGIKREAETLVVPMGESVRFARGRRNVPDAVVLEVRRPDGGTVQVYDVTITLRARFEGLRWWMYNHRILSFAVGAAAFWTMEVFFVVAGWGILVIWFAPQEDVKKEGETEVKKEEESGLSDTERSFPTYGRQPPLRYVSRVKIEGGEEEEGLPNVEADDESEEPVDVGSFHGMEDSGIGTSLSEGGSLSRRKSRKSEGGL